MKTVKFSLSSAAHLSSFELESFFNGSPDLDGSRKNELITEHLRACEQCMEKAMKGNRPKSDCNKQEKLVYLKTA